MANMGMIEYLPTHELELDKGNPRISAIFDQYEGDPNPAAIEQALYDVKGGFVSLREAIRTSGTIISPILVNRTNGSQYHVLDGNTRLCIYQTFLNDGVPGQWDKIPAMVFENLDPERIESIRLQCHLVGARDWPPYEKGKYLHDLASNQMMPINRLVDYCGGKKRDVESLIAAYKVMESEYRPCLAKRDLESGDFNANLMTAFQAALTTNVQTTLDDNHYDMLSFSEWARDGRFSRNEHVRKLPDILNDSDAKRAFLEDGGETIEALRILDSKKVQQTAQQNASELSFEDICSLLLEKLRSFGAGDIRRIFTPPENQHANLIREIRAEIDDTLDFAERN